MAVPSPAALVADLADLLDVTAIHHDLYRGRASAAGVGRVFGGQVLAQALQAAQHTVEARAAHSLHAYFMRPGAEGHPIDYRVTCDFDGGSFATRRVVATQCEQAILTLTASFQRDEAGLHHAVAVPDVPEPESLRSEWACRVEQAAMIPAPYRESLLRPRAIEFRPVAPRKWDSTEPLPPAQQAWFRTVAPLSDDPALHRAVLTYASDMMLLSTAMLPHGVSWTTPGMQTASLDHALWLHAPCRPDTWLLYATESPWSGSGRGVNRGLIFARDGTLVASVAQEGLIRRR
ncbi:acyl-CoA thioesterase [Sphingomonas sp. DT-51]|uniref:acyl-CoA thioesterase n=1 Tax=Sphingomonas sp. DT-51 TaxID=3396165 RepID=UPI003F1D7657